MIEMEQRNNVNGSHFSRSLNGYEMKFSNTLRSMKKLIVVKSK